MSFLSKPGRSWLFDVDRNPILHGVLKKTFYEQFCAGENGAECRSTIRELKDMGFRGLILTYAKETVFDHSTGSQHGLGIAEFKSESGDVAINAAVLRCPSIEAWRAGTVKTIDMTEEEDYIAVKYVARLTQSPIGKGLIVSGLLALVPKLLMLSPLEICLPSR
jgi:hypothetical protein